MTPFPHPHTRAPFKRARGAAAAAFDHTTKHLYRQKQKKGRKTPQPQARRSFRFARYLNTLLGGCGGRYSFPNSPHRWPGFARTATPRSRPGESAKMPSSSLHHQ